MAKGLHFFKRPQVAPVPTHIFYESDAGLRAFGLYSWLVHLDRNCPNFHVTIKTLEANVTDGSISIRGAMRYLEQSGYLLRAHKRTKRGTLGEIEHLLFDSPASLDYRETKALENGFVCIIDPDTGKRRGLRKAEELADALAEERDYQKASPARDAARSRKESRGYEPKGDAPEGYDELAKKSIKAPKGIHDKNAQEAFAKRVEEGHAPEEISAAYDLYIERYRKRNDDNDQYAKQLEAWLDQDEGFGIDIKKLRGMRKERAEREANSVMRRVPEEQLRQIAEDIDSTYKLYRKNYAEALEKRTEARRTNSPDESRYDKEVDKWDQLAMRRYYTIKREIADEAIKRGYVVNANKRPAPEGPTEGVGPPG